MSYVRPNITSPNYWLYMALVIANRLQKFFEEKYIDSNEIPGAVLQEAKIFFSLALDERGESGNPEESANVGAIAAHVMPQIHLLASDQFDAKLKRYADFLNQIGQRRTLDGEEIKTAEELFKFFLGLHKFGEEIHASERIHGKDYWQRHGTKLLLASAGLAGG